MAIINKQEEDSVVAALVDASDDPASHCPYRLMDLIVIWMNRV
jgi:hypothetical protein